MEFAILGPLEVRRGGRMVAVGGAKPRALLAVLLLHANEPVSAERLAIALWGEEAPAAAARTVQVYVSRLRTALGEPERLTATSAGYRLRVRPRELDATRFERLAAEGRAALAAGRHTDASGALDAALGLWRGPALADLRYEAFAQPEIARLEELRWAAIEDRLATELALGRSAVVLAETEPLIAEAPLRERLVALRMRALYQAGRQAEALAAYHQARRRLVDELGLEPGPELRALERAILTHASSLVSAASVAPAAVPAGGDRFAVVAPATPTFGREREIEAVVAAVGRLRLVTLIGTGGVGKTRLAVEAARRLEDQLPGGVVVAWLDSLVDAADVPARLAAAAGAVSMPGESPERALARRLRDEQVLIVADNFEHVLDAAPVLSRLVDSCPGVHVLATSREPLRLRGEQVIIVEPLAAAPAAALFTAAASSRRPGFDRGGEQAPAVAEICQRLDGVPLALELAAGRIGLLEPEQLAERLTDTLSLLGGGPRDAPARQRTVRATLDWSAGLLEPAERAAFFALGVFAGGGRLDAVQAVTGAPVGVLDALVSKSLAVAGKGRIRLLEVVRQYAVEGLAESGQAGAVCDRHCSLYLALAERHARDIRLHGRGPALERVADELPNLRAGLTWTLERADAERAHRLVAALQPAWSLLHLEPEGQRWADAALRLAGGPPATRARALLARALLGRWGGAQSRDDATAALPVLAAHEDHRGACAALCLLAEHHAYHGHWDRAQPHADAALGHAQLSGEPFELAYARRTLAIASPHTEGALTLVAQAVGELTAVGAHHDVARLLSTMGFKAIEDEAYMTARALLVDAVFAARRCRDPLREAFTLGNLGLATLLGGDPEGAEPHFRRELALLRDLRVDEPWEGLLGLAAVSATRGQPARAAELAAAAEPFAPARLGAGEQRVYSRLYERFVVPARERARANWIALHADHRTAAEAIAVALDRPAHAHAS